MSDKRGIIKNIKPVFCLNEREAYLKDSMENLMARSLPYFSDMRFSFSVHIKDKTGKADITVLDNRKLSKEITKKQAKGKSLIIRYKSGKSQSSSLSTEQYIRGPFGEKISGYLAAFCRTPSLRRTPIISVRTITKTIWLSRMKSLKYMISTLAVNKWKLCLHNVLKTVDGNSNTCCQSYKRT